MPQNHIHPSCNQQEPSCKIGFYLVLKAQAVAGIHSNYRYQNRRRRKKQQHNEQISSQKPKGKAGKKREHAGSSIEPEEFSQVKVFLPVFYNPLVPPRL